MDIKSCSDEELIFRLLPKEGSSNNDGEEAWNEFINRFETIIMTSIQETYRSYFKHESLKIDDAKDLMQKILLKLMKDDFSILRNIKIRHPFSVRQYLYVAATNTTHNWLRDTNRIRRNYNLTRSLDEGIADGEIAESNNECLRDKSANPEENLLQKERIEQLLQIIDSESKDEVRERNRKIFLLAYREGYTAEEIAARDDIDIKSAGITSVLNRLKKRLENFHSQPK
jgi:RNA polymerase sigma factor (sigma-70 family)